MGKKGKKGDDMTDDPFACAELQCYFLDIATLPECEKARCPWTYARMREENAVDQARKDEARGKREG
jgi:hypothetical protein